MTKTCICGGKIALDIIIKRNYTQGFEVGKRNKFEDEMVKECVGNTCGNVATMLPYLGVQTYPIGHFDLSEKGRKITSDLKRYGADTRFVKNTANGGTTLFECTHKRDKDTGKHILGYRQYSPGSRFPKRKFLRGRDEAPGLLAALNFVPDVYFFDIPESGFRVLAEGLRQKGTLVYFEPEGKDDQSKLMDAISKSDIIKFSNERFPDVSFCQEFKDKLFIQTMGNEGIRFSLRGGEWHTIAPVPNDNVVDTEGAGDWTTSQFIACLCDKDLLSLEKMNEENVRECLEKACETASRSVSYLSSKGMIDAEKGWDNELNESKGDYGKAPTTGIMGAICGDILGSKYELRSFRTKKYDFKFFPKGSHFTDDTVMTLAVARWLMGERTDKALVDNMVELGRFYPDAGYGRGFKAWLKSDVQEPYGAASNGSAMRVSAVGWICDTLDETLRLARQSASVSHNSTGGEHGAMAVAAAIFLARTGHTKEEIKDYIEKEFGYDLSRSVDAIRQDYKFEILCEKSVPEAIICWLQSDTYEQTVRNAIALGGDADTQAAIAGAIAAATPGMEIPQNIAETAFSMLTDELKEIVVTFEDSLTKH